MTAVTTFPHTSWDLVTRAKSGDRDAFAEIYRHYHPMIAGWIYQKTRDLQLTKDLTGDVFVKALTHIDTIAWQGKDIGAWLHTIARNRLADYHKSARYRLERLHDATPGEADEYPQLSVCESAETTSISHLIGRELLAAVTSLRPDYQRVIVLRFLKDLSVDETAEVMGRTRGSIRSLQHRALRVLAESQSVQALAVAA